MTSESRKVSNCHYLIFQCEPRLNAEFHHSHEPTVHRCNVCRLSILPCARLYVVGSFDTSKSPSESFFVAEASSLRAFPSVGIQPTRDDVVNGLKPILRVVQVCLLTNACNSRLVNRFSNLFFAAAGSLRYETAVPKLVGKCFKCV